jgi:glycosyltransferase involved in cell wall biosynthesis
MRWIFFDPLDLDYDVASPLERPLGGSQSALCYLSTALADSGHDVTTLTGTTRPRRIGRVTCAPHRHVPSTLFGGAETLVVVLNGPADAAPGLRGMLPAGVRLVLWAHHAHDQPAMQALSNRAYSAQWDKIVCISEWQRITFAELLGVPTATVEVLRNAVTAPFERLFQDFADFERAKSGVPRLVYTSTPFRGLDVLMNCFPGIRARHPECELEVYSSMRVYGVEEALDDYRELYTQCGRTVGATYRGSVSQRELAQGMRAATVLAYPNTFPETSCIAVLEALAAGALVVTSDLAALPETCGGHAHLVAPISPRRARTDYERDFVAAISGALDELKTDRAAFLARCYDQTRAVTAAQTWKQRASEWEQSARGWLESH